MVGAPYIYSSYLYYVVFQSPGPLPRRKEGSQGSLLQGKWGEKLGQQCRPKCGTTSPYSGSHPVPRGAFRERDAAWATWTPGSGVGPRSPGEFPGIPMSGHS